MTGKSPPLSVEDLRTQIERGEIDSVVVTATDMQGRLQGKRIHADGGFSATDVTPVEAG